MSPLTYKEFECRAGMSKQLGYLEGLGSLLAFCLWEALGLSGGGGVRGGGGGERKKKKKKVGSRGHRLFFFFFFSFLFSFCHPPPPPPPSPSVLFAYSFALPPSPLLLPYQETPDCHALRPLHEPPYPPLLIDLIARNFGTHRDALQRLKNIKNPTRAKMGAPQRPFLFF